MSIHSAKPGSIRQFKPRTLKLQNIGALPPQEMRRLLEGAQGSLTSLSIQGWTPVLERNRGRFQHFYDARSVFAAFDCASEITELEWRQISLPLSLTLQITCCFRNLVTLRLGISAEDSGDERNFFQLHALQMLPNLKELRIVEDQDFFGHVYCPLTCLGLALAPLRNLVILDMGEVPVWKDTDAIPSLLVMLEQLKYLMELRTLRGHLEMLFQFLVTLFLKPWALNPKPWALGPGP